MSLQDIIKTNNIVRILPWENLSSALTKLSTSHDAAFVFTPENKYLGVINPYYCLIKSSYPGNAKVEHCLYHAPRVRINHPLTKVASLFMQSKIHYLPVFDVEDHFLGIISARHILSQFHALPVFKTSITRALKYKNHPMIVIYENDSVATAINIFKQSKVSKLIVVSRDLKLKGILSHYDLIAYLVAPKNSPEKISFYHQPVKLFAKTYVLTLSPEHTLADVIKLILEKRIGSVVVVDKTRHPIGIITTKDLLRFFINEQQEKNRRILGGFFNAIRPLGMFA